MTINLTLQSKTLVGTIPPIIQGENIADAIKITIPKQLKGIDFTQTTMLFHWVNARNQFNVFGAELIEQDDQLTATIPITDDMTVIQGNLVFWLVFVNHRNELVLKSHSRAMAIANSQDGSELLTEEQLGLLAQWEMRMLSIDQAVQVSIDQAALSETHAKESEVQSARSATNANLSETNAAASATAAKSSESNAKTSETNSKTSETSSKTSETKSSQALTDLLAMLGSDIPILVGGKIPVEQIPFAATTEIYRVSDESELTSLVAQRGDLAELIEVIDGESTVTKTWQLLGDSTNRSDWIVWGTSYAVQAGNATTAANATNASMINNHRLVIMTQSEYDNAVIDPDTLYFVR